MQFWSDSLTFQNPNLIIFLRVSGLGFFDINCKTLGLYWIIHTMQPELLHQWEKKNKTPNYFSPFLSGIYKLQPCHVPLEITTLPQHPNRGQNLAWRWSSRRLLRAVEESFISSLIHLKINLQVPPWSAFSQPSSWCSSAQPQDPMTGENLQCFCSNSTDS